MGTDFRECVIIPLAMFEKCNFRQVQTPPFQFTAQDKKADSVLFDNTLPSDLKMKLYHQQTKLSPPQTKYQKVEIFKPPVESPHQEETDIESIVQGISSKNTPYANSILSKILQNRETIHWNDKLEVVINNKRYPGSDIIDLMRYVLGEKVITSSNDIPIAGRSFKDTLIDIGVPRTWLKQPKKQRGHGWVSYDV